ncbi:condensin-2 complex subunit H2 isoform X2 [Solea solea]|uniref:condensin-2 complex subunit H2 isoform X2 n=1 Tax=Solea solea TaxID=90069 RepID=UPI002729DD8C|nr:condensin-2 complex subunit H2 isoform X2 [Solea solea]
MESTESRFAHLLQPIRELAKNWDVDVASELNDYLEELDEMCIEFDGGRIQLNFAEAALLVQGSTCIYSKKVELLHTLVYQTLEYINNKNKNLERNKQSSESQNVDSAVSQSDADDIDVFTVMDAEASAYSLKPEGKTAVEVVRLPPDALVTPGSFEKNKFPMISLKGEVFCSLKDFKMNLFFPGDKGQIFLTYGSRNQDSHLDHVLNLDQDLDHHQQEEQGVLAPPTGDATVGVAIVEDCGHEDDFVPLNDVMDVDQEAEEHVERQQVNVWALHDPYVCFGEEKPLKTGKSYKVPNGLDDRGKRKRKQAPALQDFRSWFTGTFDPPEHKLRHGPTFTDLNYIFLNTIKEKLRSQRRIFRRTGVMVSDEELKKTLLQPEEEGAEPVDEFRHADLLLGGGDNDDNSDSEQGAFPDDFPAEFGGGDDISPDANNEDLSYEDLVRLRIEQLVVNCQGYTQETELSRRVKEWEDMIRPELAMQEERPIFDIHDYGDRIVAALGSVGSRQEFSSIVHGLDNFEACKYMLASLQLANDNTVDVDSAEGLEDSLDSMGLTLLSLHRAADRFNQDEFGVTTA